MTRGRPMNTKGNIVRRVRGALVLWAAGLMFSPLALADVSEATFTPQGSTVYPPASPEDVQVFVYKPDFKFRIIGVIEARGMAGPDGSLLDSLDITRLLSAPPGEKEDIALAMSALKSEAAKAGASGVLIIQSRQVRVSDNATERRITAAAIRQLE